MEIHPSVRRQGVVDADMLHAIEHSMVVDEVGSDPDRWLLIGPDRAANPSELVVLVTAEGDELIIHACRSAPSTGGCSTHDEAHPRPHQVRHAHHDELGEGLADEAEAGYDVDQIVARRSKRGRPRLGAEPSIVESVRLDPELKQRLLRRADEEGIPVSEVIREALRKHLGTT